MAITKILHMKEAKGTKGKHLKQALLYIQNANKTENGKYVTGINCQPQYAYSQMIRTKELFNKTDKRQGYHIIISFEEGEITADKAFEFMGRFVKDYLGKEYQAVYAVHTDMAHIHGHIIFNSVSFLTGRKYRYEKGDWAKYMQPLTNKICEEYGLSTIRIEEDRTEEDKQSVQDEWVDYEAGRYIWSDMIRRDVDACILLSDSFDTFLTMLKDRGYEVKQNKYLAIKPPGMKRFRRCKSLGEKYTEEMIQKRINMENTLPEIIRNAGEPIAASVLWVKVPYRVKRAKLSGIQRMYFAKLYRIGLLRKRPYSQAWRYREEIRKMHRLHDQYLFLSEYEIHNTSELEQICEKIKKRQQKCTTEKRSFYKEKNRFKELFSYLEKMDTVLPGYRSYIEGDHFFDEEYKEYSKLSDKLCENGYTYDEIKEIQRYYQSKGKEIWAELKKNKRELSAAMGILEDVRKQEQTILMERKKDELMEMVEATDNYIREVEETETKKEIKEKEADANAHDIIR